MASKGGDLFEKWVVDPIKMPLETIKASDPLTQWATGNDVSFNPDKNLDSALRATYQNDPVGSTIGGNENDAVRAGKIVAAAAALFFGAAAAGVGAESGAAGAGAEAGTGAAGVGAGTGAVEGGAGWVSAEGGAGYAGGAASDAAVGAGSGVDLLKLAKDGASLASAGAAVANATAKPPTPPTAPAPPPPAQRATAADTTAIRKRNSLLFGADSPATTDITGGRAGISNLGRVSLLGGTSRLGA